MEKEQKKILISRIGLLIIFIVSMPIACICFAKLDSDYGLIISIVGIYVAVFSFSFLLASLISVRCRVYYYNDNKIIIYGGFYKHYVKLNDEIVDEHNTLFCMTHIILEFDFDDGAKGMVRLSTTNHITFKINNKLVKWN